MGVFAITGEGTEIAFMSEINALGVCIDEQLSFNAHVDHICTMAGRQVGTLQRLTGVLDYESRFAIYKNFIMSNFDYLSCRASITKMVKDQERALSFVLKDSHFSYEMLGKLKVDSIGINGPKFVFRHLKAFKWLQSELLVCRVWMAQHPLWYNGLW